ncbi:MAG: transrane protein [Massilia sp.]|nr:transrane protein [Massilia sp.]
MDLATQVIKQQKRYIDKGAKSGKDGLPPTNAHPFDVNETQLISEVKRLSQESYNKYRTFVASKGRVLADIENDLSAVEPTCDAVLSNQDLSLTAEQARVTEQSTLVKLAEKVLRLRAELRAFRITHNITESAVYPDNPTIPYLWMLPILLLETLLGAAFYENANGLIGGAAAAFGVSFLNVLVAFTCGALFRYKNLGSPILRVGGYATLFAAVFLGICLNTLFASYRAEYQLLTDPSDPAQLGQAFVIALHSAPNIFMLRAPASDLSSFTLFFLGLAGFGFAFYKGLNVSDRYPGYGPRARRLKMAEDDFDVHAQVVKSRISDEIDRHKQSLAKAKNSLAQAQPAVEQLKLALSNEHRQMHSQQVSLKNAFALVLSSYRETNVAVRPNQPPAYFGLVPDLFEDAMNDAGDELAAAIAAIEAKIVALRESYQSLLTDAMSEMSNQSKQVLGDEFAKYLKDVMTQASEEIDSGNLVAPKMQLVA